MQPSVLYDRDVQKHQIEEDAAQRKVLQVLDELHDTLLVSSKKLLWPFVTRSEIKGVYIYGAVGRGKTYLMDLFYQSLNIPKIRLHFYEFMNQVHVELKMLQGQVNPLKKVVEGLAKKARIICLDEFFVEDIADAMILATLLEGLFHMGIVLVTTSNVDPKDLYQDGLQRDRFLPAIQLIQAHMTVLDLKHPTDYRLLTHLLASHQKTGNLTHIDFAELCEAARSSLDYLALAKHCEGILMQKITDLTGKDDAARRFITLIDIFYDQHLPVILAGVASFADLYHGKRLAFQFERTKSRLTEMMGWVDF